MGISHCRLDCDCINVNSIDFRDDTIAVEVHGFEKVHLELLGINGDMQVADMNGGEGVLSKLHGFGE